MGNKFLESNPPIFGKKNYFSQKEKEYFNRVNLILHKNYRENLYSDYNLEVSLEQKNFENTEIKHGKLEDISWVDYIHRHLYFVNKKYRNAPWPIELQEEISKENFMSENKYFSEFFYNEYFFSTSPKIFDFNYKDYLKDLNTDYNNNSLIDLNNSINNNVYSELDVTDNYGGSYLEMNLDNLDQNDPTFQYKLKRINLKKYIKIFKEHIYNNHHHPINRVVFLFNKFFCKYINQNIENFDNQLKNQLIEENFEKKIKNFEKEITECLRNFIIAMNCSLKLFYSTCINYSCFDEEKDDLMNLITSLFFKTGKLYESIYSLYSLSFSHDIENLQEKLNDLRNVKPKDLGVQIKFCLDENTLELQKNILKEKRAKKENENGEKVKQLFQIKENTEEEKDEGDNNKNNKKKVNNIINTNSNDINDYNNVKDEDDYLLEKINDDISLDMNADVLTHLRNTVNSFNNKKYLFPKIRENLNEALALNEKYIREAKASGKLPIPFSSAIKLLKNIKHYKTPFEKIVILAALSDQITESVSNFWNKMTEYIKNSFLFIEVDEIMAIFIFIVIKAQMPDMFVETKIITNFTTPTTKAFNISYNLTLMEASLETISKMDNTKEIGNLDKLNEVRKSIAALTTQRLSRLSRVSFHPNPS